MQSNVEQILHDCAEGARNHTLTFPEIVGRLSTAGVERYHADYSRHEITYYLADGQSHVVSVPHADAAAADAFCVEGVELAVRQSQRNEHSYLDFIRKTLAAGCVGYFVQITGRRVIYFGRRGECHVEHFPSPVSTP